MLIFGSDTAQDDPLLYACPVPNWHAYQRPILVGRWGTGKTAAMLLANQQLSEELDSINASNSRMWLLDEHTFRPLDLHRLKIEYSTHPDLLKRVLESLWYGEIITVWCRLLIVLHSKYGSPHGPHWDHISHVAKSSGSYGRLWQAIPEMAKLILGSEDGRAKAIMGMKHHIDSKVQEETYRQLHYCLRDIKDKNPQPIVAVEPIETPGAALDEEAGVAQAIVTALLNVFSRKFRPSGDQLLRVRITVPWHRYELAKVDSPQRLYENKILMRWTEQDLLKFINLRIERELKNIGRKVPSKGINPWQTLFEHKITNKYCGMIEDSWEYVLRHTHHRARDVLRLTRCAIEHFARTKGTAPEDALAGKFGRISGNAVRDAIRAEGMQLTKELKDEALRKYPDLCKILDRLRGKQIPFDIDNLKNWTNDLEIEFVKVQEALWYSGFLGIEITPSNDSEIREVRETLGTEGRRIFHSPKIKNPLPRWFLFEYNWDGQLDTLLARFPNMSRLILHAKVFEDLRPRTEKDHPFGA